MKKYSHYDDVLEQLRSVDGVASRMLQIDECTTSVKDTLASAADEIERLRKDNHALRARCRGLESRYTRLVESF